MASMIGLSVARANGWELCSSCAPGYKVRAFRQRGAVLVDKVYNGENSWVPWVFWYGIPPNATIEELEVLARQAGQMGEYGIPAFYPPTE